MFTGKNEMTINDVADTVVYIDMDGVIADYELAYEALFNMSIENTDPKDFEMIKSQMPARKFFEMLPPMPLVDVLMRHPGKFQILTACGDYDVELVAKQKLEWLTRVFGENVPVFNWVAKSHEKARFANPNTLLIDDRAKCLIPFSNANGRILRYDGLASQDKLIDRILSLVK